MNMFIQACAIALACLTVPAMAQVDAGTKARAPAGFLPGQAQFCSNDGGTTWVACPVTPAASVANASSTTTSGTIATTNTYQSILAADAARKGCLIQNTSPVTELRFVGAPGGATAANSFSVAAGGTFSCASGPIVVTDQPSMTSGTAGSTFVVVKQ